MEEWRSGLNYSLVLGLLLLLVLHTQIDIVGGSDKAEEDDPTEQLNHPVRGYGEPCTCDQDCDFSKWLTCSSAAAGICTCLSRTFTFDHHRQSCVVKLGEKCFEIAQDYTQYKDLPPFIRCVSGAFCSISAGGLCACNTYGYYETLSKERCERKKEYGSRCAKSVECKSDSCQGGLCGCREGEYYDKTADRCLGLVGSYCFTDDDCTANAICNSIQGARCSCSKGFSPTVKGECVKSLNHGDPCNASSPCNNIQLACVNNVCSCQYPDHQVYDKISGNCLSHAHSAPCLGDHTCVPNSICSLSGLLSECQCSEGTVEMPDGSCQTFSSYGGKCQSDDQCDPLASLSCKDFSCQCRDALTLYDPQSRLCRGLVGYRHCQLNDNLCVQNAHCLQSNPQLKPRCTCKSSYVTTARRMCIENFITSE